MNNIDISKITVEELLALEGKVNTNQFCIHVQNYVHMRTFKKDYFNMDEIQMFSELLNRLKNNFSINNKSKSNLEKNINNILGLSIQNLNYNNKRLFDLSADEVMSFKDRVSFNTFGIIVKNYITSRIKNRIYCDKEEIPNLMKLYDYFNNDERSSLKYIQDLFLDIDELKKMSRGIKNISEKSININLLTIKELISLNNKLKDDRYLTLIQTYIHNRISNQKYLSDTEIDELRDLVNAVNAKKDLNTTIKKNIFDKIIRLIVISKNKDKKNYIKRLSRISMLTFDELFLYLETIVNYTDFCISENDLKEIIALFKNDEEYIKKVIYILNNSKLKDKFSNLINKLDSKLRIKKLFLTDVPTINFDTFNYLDETLPFIGDKNVITIDESYSPDLDGAFSIEKKGDIYFLNVYITDVPSFLLINEDLMKEAYRNATSMYNHQNREKMLIRDMIPASLSHDFLSLKMNRVRNVITFSYQIDSLGNVLLSNVSRNSVFINDNINPYRASGVMIYNKDDKYLSDLKLYREVCELVCKKSNERFLSDIDRSSISDLIGFTSVLTNYQVGHNSNMAIYRDKGLYTKESSSHYTHSVTPLRRFVSDINLALYLNQLGIISCPDKYIYYFEDNIDEIIGHLNDQEIASRYFENNYRLIKKYYE